MSASQSMEPFGRQFSCTHQMLREAVTSCPADEWRKGTTEFFSPARLAFHVVQATDFHLDATPKAFNWDRFGVNWEESPVDALPDQAQLLAYIDEVEAKLTARLQWLATEGPLAPDYAGHFPTALDHLLYLLRHIQHHVGQINAELKTRGLKPAEWR